MQDLQKEQLFGIPYVVSHLEEASEFWSEDAAACPCAKLIAHSDVHVLTRILHEEDYGKGVLENFDYICPDGMPIVWLLRHKKGRDARRLYGPDAMEWMWDRGRRHGLRHFLLGGTEEACAKLKENLQKRFPGAELAGHYCPPMPPWPEGEDERMLAKIRESGANCVWVGLGCPKQERWLFRHKADLPPAYYFAVGAAFNFHAGLVQQAPAWIRSHGLEWLYRICKEPRRLLKRYLVHNTRFLWYCASRKF